MKKGRKILLLTGTVLLLLCLFFYGYVLYQRQASFSTTIPKHATSLVRVNVYVLYRSMLIDYIAQRQKEDGPSIIEGLEIPADIFIYTLKGKGPATLFTSLEIADQDLFRKTVARWGLTLSSDKMPEGIHFGANASGTFSLAYNHDRVFFCWSYHKEEVQDILINLLRGKDMVQVSESIFAAIEEQEAHIAWLSGSGNGSVDFSKGFIKAELSLSVPGLILPEQVEHQAPDKQAVINMWLYASGQSLAIPNQIEIDSLMVNNDSIQSYFPKGFELCVTGPVVQKDSVVTYEYNDDFEKVATVTVQESSVPGMQVAINCEATGLYSYLQAQSIINSDSNLVNRIIFPLYQLYAFPKENYLYLSTTRQLREPVKRRKTNDFFGLNVDFVQMGKQQEFDLLKPYIKKLHKLDASASKDKSGNVVLKATIWSNDKNTNVAWQLLESL